MSLMGAGYSDNLSVEAMVRHHNEALLRYLGDERKEHLLHVKRELADFFQRAKKDPKIDIDQVERAQQLLSYVERDLSQCVPAPMPEEDESPNEP